MSAFPAMRLGPRTSERGGFFSGFLSARWGWGVIPDVEPGPIKIVRILGRLNIGGPAIHSVLLTEGLNDQKFHSTLVTGAVGKSEGNMLYFARQHGVTPLIVSELGRELSWRDDLVALWKLYRVLRNERPHIVHTHTAKAGTLGRIAAVLARVPVRIHTFHGHVFDGYFGPRKTKLFIIIERFLAFFTTKIVAISNAQLADLSGHYRIAPPGKFRVIPIGLDLASLPQLREREVRLGLGLADDEIVIGWVGRLVPIKNPHMALRVFGRLIRNGAVKRRVRLLVAGDGELRSELQDQASQAGFGSQILFTGWRRDLSDLYPVLDLVIVTSLNEGTPLVLIEAMAAGLPFVATRVGGLSDLVFGPEQVIRAANGVPLFSLHANGALAQSDEVEGFTAAVQYLLRDPDRMRSMGAEGRKFVMGRYSKERLVKDTQALYQDCLAKHGRVALRQTTGPSGQEEKVYPSNR